MAKDKLPHYKNKAVRQFVHDMQWAGLKVEHYYGRFFWQGPAVRVDNLQQALSNTKVACQWDNMGKGYIVHPVEKDAGSMEK